MTQPTSRRVAVIGSGVAGLTAAYVCATGDDAAAEVTLFEAADRLGGHADTHRVLDPSGRELGIDTGFIVHNARTYPTLLRLFAELGVPTQESEMSMSMADDTSGITWAGARGLGGLIPTGAHRMSSLSGHARMLREIPRFHRAARALLAEEGEDLTPLADFLQQGGFSAYFVRHFMEPLVAAVWSCDPELAGAYPARYLFAFLAHHGMLSVSGSPSWRTVTGGSKVYVDRVLAALEARGGQVRLGATVTGVLDTGSAVEITANGVQEVFDQVVIATHPHQALAMLGDASPLHKEVLGAITYSPNTAVLHTDTSLLPHADRLRASWNFRRRREGAGPVTITYDLTRLQRLPTDTRYLVTLGGEGLIDPAQVIDMMAYEHPLYTPASVAAQRRLPELDTDRIAFAGAYHGWGFHEDGARSGLAAAERLGHTWAPAPAREAGPQIYRTTVEHVRRRPWPRAFRLRSWMWVVDLDELPQGFARIEARDHLGDPALGVRENLAAFLALNDIELGDARVRLAAQPRAFGHCFNPISVFWCTRRDGTPLATVVEVHNTYGDRHAYVLDRPTHGTVTKQLYVSPFHGVDGSYRVSVPEPDDQLSITVVLRTPDGARFSASLRGDRVRAG
ncbi:MAG TPA: FAD-dependent oxidoreductase, partial [Nocardioides sp.]|nr:FAD-dependent oxidoreductase [Nocardioides sp.]